MIISTKLLKEIVDFDFSTEELAEKLTSIGMEVEGIRKIRHTFKDIITGRILENKNIPGTKLSNVKVDLGKTVFQIVTAATNLKEEDVVAVALPGSLTADGTEISEKNFSGKISKGMLCSYSELGIEGEILSQDEKEGILIFPEGTPIGVHVEEILPIDDDLMELSLLPDRADGFYVMGVARWIEVLKSREKGKKADFTNLLPKLNLEIFGKTDFPIHIEDNKLCDVYSGRIIRDVKVKKSSVSLRKYLFLLRVRPINNIVDITNYVAKLYGQPLHAFDLDKLREKIVIRLATKGEKIKTLDGIERSLTENNLLIADTSGPIAIAGVMGGESTSVTEATNNILLESAHFNARIISKSSRTIPLITDASTLFEKGTDETFPSSASKIAALLIQKEANGKPFEENIVSYLVQREPIKVRFEKISSLLGTDLTKKEVCNYLNYEGLDFIEKKDHLLVTSPAFRQDLSIEEDLIEEIIRMKGYNEFGEKPILSELKSGTRTHFENFVWLLKDLLVNLGLSEICTTSLSNIELLKKTSSYNENRAIRIINPLNEEMSILRPDLFPTMFAVLERNFNMQNSNLSLFEIGNVFKKENGEFKEILEASIIISGDRISENGFNAKLPYDFYYLKGLIEEVLETLQIDFRIKEKKFEYLNPMQSASIHTKNKLIGFLGKISNDLAKNAFFATLNIDMLYELSGMNIHFKEFSVFPAVKRDIAVVVDEDLPEIEVRRTIHKANSRELKSIILFDIYKGRPLPPNKKNLAYSLEFSSLTRTLTGEEVDKIIDIIEERIKKEIGGELRKK